MIRINTARQYRTELARFAALAESGNLADDPDAAHEDAGYDRAEARMAAAEQGIQYVDEQDIDDWDGAVPF